MPLARVALIPSIVRVALSIVALVSESSPALASMSATLIPSTLIPPSLPPPSPPPGGQAVRMTDTNNKKTTTNSILPLLGICSPPLLDLTESLVNVESRDLSEFGFMLISFSPDLATSLLRTAMLTISLRPLGKTAPHRLKHRPNEPRNLVQVRQVLGPTARHMLDATTPYNRYSLYFPLFQPHADNKSCGIVFE
ncbi:MAG: hypothetical protein JW384_00807 [Nitrosomonadaceae bacterium]|nr:hypothetical protein [Nitrosomonadaceae bacterium]